MTGAVLGVLAGALAGLVVGFLVGRARAGHPDGTDRDHPTLTGGPPASVSGAGLDDVLAGHPTGVIVADRSGRVEFRNRASVRLQGTHTGTLLDAAIDRHLATARAGAGSARETVEFYGPPRAVFEVWAQGISGGGSVAFVEDVSERRRLDQVRTDFVANISHELRTPVGALSVLAETIVDETDPGTIRRIVTRMLAESERATRTIDDLIELSRIESRGERAKEPVAVGAVLREALDRVAELAAQRDITISTLDRVDHDGQRSAGLVVIGDRRELVSAVGNLVENAVKYSDSGASVHVRANRIDGWVEITVSDQGVGIPQRDLDRVFERFYRVDRARSRTTGGTGLGLSIVRHVASNHGGEVQVTSTEGEGSTFVLRLPAHSEPATGETDEAGVA